MPVVPGSAPAVPLAGVRNRSMVREELSSGQDSGAPTEEQATFSRGEAQDRSTEG